MTFNGFNGCISKRICYAFTRVIFVSAWITFCSFTHYKCVFSREEVCNVIVLFYYLSSSCLVKSILTNRDLGEGVAHPTDIFHRHLWQIYQMWTDERHHRGSGGLSHFISSLGVKSHRECSWKSSLIGWLSQFHPTVQLQAEFTSSDSLLKPWMENKCS